MLHVSNIRGDFFHNLRDIQPIDFLNSTLFPYQEQLHQLGFPATPKATMAKLKAMVKRRFPMELSAEIEKLCNQYSDLFSFTDFH